MNKATPLDFDNILPDFNKLPKDNSPTYGSEDLMPPTTQKSNLATELEQAQSTLSAVDKAQLGKELYWKNKPLETYSKEDLFEVINTLTKQLLAMGQKMTEAMARQREG